MIIIPIGDWFLARSEAFKILMMKFRDHKIQTKQAFSKVKSKHNQYENVLKEHKERIEEMEKILLSLKEVTPFKIKKKKTNNEDNP